MRITIHIDGGSRGNPGPAGVGIVLDNAETKKPLCKAGYFIGKATNNVAEYTGLIRALEQAKRLKANSLDIYSDSQLMVRQIIGQYRVKSPDLKPLYNDAIALLNQFDQWEIQHIYREQNKEADELANLAMDAKADIIAGEDNLGAAAQDSATSQPSVPADQSWHVEFATKVGDTCPAGHDKSMTFEIGSTLPQGMCVFAAYAILDAVLNAAPKSPKSHRVRCAGCGASIRIKQSKS